MTRIKTKVFKSNQGQVVRLPKSVALPENIREVDIIAIGNTRVITPSVKSWDEWFDGLGVSNDFMSAREQPADQK